MINMLKRYSRSQSNHANTPVLLNYEKTDIKILEVVIEFTRIGEIGNSKRFGLKN